MLTLGAGPQCCGTLEESSAREWLVADGLGGYATGTVAGLRTRRYHGLLVVARGAGRRMLGLASLDPVLDRGGSRVRLATHEWASGAVDPVGHEHLVRFSLEHGVPRWTFSVGDVVLEREVASHRGRPGVAVVHRVVRAPAPVRLEVEALCTWRDSHGSRLAGADPEVARVASGFVFEGAYRVRGPGFEPDGAWYRGVHYRVEKERGLDCVEDLWFAGRFVAELSAGESLEVDAWAGDLSDEPQGASGAVRSARARTAALVGSSGVSDETSRALVAAADAFVVDGPDVVAGYPWFGSWSRDTMTSYEGLFLTTGRPEEGRALLERAAGTLSEGMLANTADTGETTYNTVDATLWMLHSVGRHVELTGDLDLAAALAGPLSEAVAHHVAGTRFGIRVDADGLLTGGAPGVALTWMDARVDGVPVTARAGKPVEVNALWVSGLASLASLLDATGEDSARIRSLESSARESFVRRFVRPDGRGCYDVVDGPGGDDASVRPNQLLALSLPHAPLEDRAALLACAPLLTPLGLRSLAPADLAYRPVHRGDVASRDRAYHEGTVWPWLVGPYVDACDRLGVSREGVLDGLLAHLADDGIGSVSEAADGDAPHGATGCPFQAWSVAELLRVGARGPSPV
ncbi:MAG: glycogen debranching enzyme N-terminal domain-containing protein [Actinomycetota bacterium]|nr:glycogen debranching enzyme N-terminal domain-containing protein [Actinomycetota bacterium]